MINQRKQTTDVFKLESSTEGNRDTKKKVDDGGAFEYCKATPESKEWHAYQLQRVLSIKELKMKNLKLEKLAVGDMMTKGPNKKLNKHLSSIKTASETLEPLEYPPRRSTTIPAILKKVKKRTFNSQPKDISYVTWKEPVADTKFLPVGWMKVPVAPKLHQTEAPPCEEVLERSKISSVESNAKRKSGIAGKQLFINFTDRSGKNKKPYKRNNEKNNLGSPAANVESQDNSAEVNRMGRRNNAEATKMNSENSSKYGNEMSASSLQSPEIETTPRIDSPPTTGKTLFKQAFKRDSSSSAKVNSAMKEGAALVFGVKQDPSAPHDNSKSAFSEISSSNTFHEISHGIASAYNSLVSNADIQVQGKWLREATAHCTYKDDTHFTKCPDLNGNTIVYVPTEKLTNVAFQNIPTAVAFGIDPKDEKSSNGDCSTSNCTNEEDQMNEVQIKNEDIKLIDSCKGFIQKNKLFCPACTNLRFLNKNSLAKECEVRTTLEKSKMQPDQGKNKTRSINSVESLLSHFKPPTLPEFEVCNVLPGTPAWQKYWDEFNQKIGKYYSCVENYSKKMDDLLVDDDGYEYKKELRKRHQEETALKIRMGLTMPKPPLIRHPLKDTIEIGGYAIRPLGGVVDRAYVSTCGHNSFRLEIPCVEVNSDLECITIDAKLNVMTIAIPSGCKDLPFIKLIQISVPNYKKVQNLEVGHPLHNGGNIIVTGK